MRTIFIDRDTRAIANVSDNIIQGGMDLNRINVPTPHTGRGIGRRLMAEVLANADAEGVVLWLDINPYGPMDHAALEAWYLRCGFEPVEGRYRRLPREQA